MPETETESEIETVITVRVDERTRREAEAALRPFGLTASQLFSVLLEGMARYQRLAAMLAQWANSFRPPPVIPNTETIEAMEAARRGELKTFATIEELFADLHSDAEG